MADEEVKPIEEVKPEEPKQEEPAQEELPLAAAEETPKEEPAIEAKAEEPKPEEKPAEEPKPDWKEKELKSKHRQLQEAKRREQELQAKLETQQALLAKFNQSQPDQIQTVPADEVERKANELVAQRQYIENCNKAAQLGEKTYGDWKSAIENLELLGGFDSPTMNGVLATDDPAKVLYELGKQPDHYHRIMALPYERRIIEMNKIAEKAMQAKPVSNAPAPVNPISGKAAPARETLRDEFDDDKWYQIRLAQKRQKWDREHRR